MKNKLEEHVYDGDQLRVTFEDAYSWDDPESRIMHAKTRYGEPRGDYTPVFELPDGRVVVVATKTGHQLLRDDIENVCGSVYLAAVRLIREESVL